MSTATAPAPTHELPLYGPDAPKRVAPKPPTGKPMAEWTDEQLTQQAAASFSRYTAAEDQLTTLGRKTLAAYMYAGQALAILHDRLTKNGTWTDWQTTHANTFGSRPTINDCIRFFRAASAKPALVATCVTVAEAKHALGIYGGEPKERAPSDQRPRKPLTFQRAAAKLSRVVDTLDEVEHGWRTVRKDANLDELKELRDKLHERLTKLDELVKQVEVQAAAATK